MTGLSENETLLIVGTSVIGLIAYMQIVSHRHLVAKVEVALAVGFGFLILPTGTFFSYVSILLNIPLRYIVIDLMWF